MSPWERVRAKTLVLLAVGFASAVAIYLTAQPPAGNPLGYEPEDTKKYVRDMELYGGKANMIAYELRQWFVSLWHGKRLAFTVGVLTVVVACAFVFFTAPLPPDIEARAGGEEQPGGPGPT